MSGFRRGFERWLNKDERDEELAREIRADRRYEQGLDYGGYKSITGEYGVERGRKLVGEDPFSISRRELFDATGRRNQTIVASIHDEVEFSCYRYGQETGVEVSSHCQRLIADIFAAAIIDPNPHWTASEEFVRDRIEILLGNLPLLLNEVRGRSRAPITSFDVLHFLTVRLHDICPFR